MTGSARTQLATVRRDDNESESEYGHTVTPPLKTPDCDSCSVGMGAFDVLIERYLVRVLLVADGAREWCTAPILRRLLSRGGFSSCS